jgi:hypothetical protein
MCEWPRFAGSSGIADFWSFILQLRGHWAMEQSFLVPPASAYSDSDSIIKVWSSAEVPSLG